MTRDMRYETRDLRGADRLIGLWDDGVKSVYKIISFVLLILFLSVCWLNICNICSASEDGGDAGAFLKNGVGVRPISMGKAFVAVADDANAGYWNPAGLAMLNGAQLNVMYSNPMNQALMDGAGVEDIGYHTVGLAYPTSIGSLGLNLAYLSAGNIEEVTKDLTTGEPVFTNKTFADKELGFIASYAKSITDKIHLGLNLKVVHQQIGDKKGSGLGLDIGGLYQPLYNLTFGLMLQDLVEPKIQLLKDGKTYSIPRKVKFGISYRLMEDKILLATGIDGSRDRSPKFHFGAEVEPMKDLAFRAGYTTDTGEITAGVGVKVSIMQIDYGFGFLDLGSTHRVSLTLDFSRLTVTKKASQ